MNLLSLANMNQISMISCQPTESNQMNCRLSDSVKKESQNKKELLKETSMNLNLRTYVTMLLKPGRKKQRLKIKQLFKIIKFGKLGRRPKEKIFRLGKLWRRLKELGRRLKELGRRLKELGRRLKDWLSRLVILETPWWGLGKLGRRLKELGRSLKELGRRLKDRLVILETPW